MILQVVHDWCCLTFIHMTSWIQTDLVTHSLNNKPEVLEHQHNEPVCQVMAAVHTSPTFDLPTVNGCCKPVCSSLQLRTQPKLKQWPRSVWSNVRAVNMTLAWTKGMAQHALQTCALGVLLHRYSCNASSHHPADFACAFSSAAWSPRLKACGVWVLGRSPNCSQKER